MGYMGNGAHGPWGHRGLWGTGYRHIGNETHMGKGVQRYGYRGMGHMVNKANRGVGHRGCGVQRVWGTLAIDHNGYRGMGHMGNGTHG